MDMIPRNDYGERCQFDAYCKLVLYHEAIDYLREMQRRRDRELSFSDLPQMEMDKLCVVDHYPSDRFTFSSHGYDLHIENELVADAFAGLSVQEQSILILHFVLDLPDQEVEGMKKPTYKGKELLPLSVIDAARDGDSQAVDQVLRYYEDYINKLCTRTLYDPDSQPHVRVDEYMKRRLEIKLIHSIILKEFAKLREDAGLPKVVFHSLRHSSTTYKLKLNHGDLKATQGDTGHAEIDMITSIYAHILDEDRKVNAQKFETAFYAKPDLRNVRPPEEPAKSEPATLDLESLVEQLQKSPELASALAALIAAQAPAK